MVSSSPSLEGIGAPFEALEEVARGGPRSGVALMGWLQRHPALRRVPEYLRDDVVQSVGLTLLLRGASILARLRNRHVGPLTGAAGDRKITAYVSAMLRNRAIDFRRRPATCSLDEAALVVLHCPEAHGEIRQILRAIRTAMDQAAASSSPKGADAVRQLWAIAFGEASFASYVDRRVIEVGDPSPEARVRARDCLYKRYGRARRDTVAALSDLVRSGRLDPEIAERCRIAVDQLFRMGD